jgi:hypothetical protein
MTANPARRAGPAARPVNRRIRRPIRSITMRQPLSRAHARPQGTGREAA